MSARRRNKVRALAGVSSADVLRWNRISPAVRVIFRPGPRDTLGSRSSHRVSDLRLLWLSRSAGSFPTHVFIAGHSQDRTPQSPVLRNVDCERNMLAAVHGSPQIAYCPLHHSCLRGVLICRSRDVEQGHAGGRAFGAQRGQPRAGRVRRQGDPRSVQGPDADPRC